MSTSTGTITERDLTHYVADVAAAYGWLRFHTWLSKHSTAGFPDEILLRGPRLIVAELKSERGRLTEAQTLWLEAFRAVPGIEVHVWRPRDLDRIAEVLR